MRKILKKLKFLKHIIDKSNHEEAVKYCRQIAKRHDKNLDYALKMYETIKQGKAKIYFFEDGGYEYKRIK